MQYVYSYINWSSVYKEMELTENLQDRENEIVSEAKIHSFIVRVWKEESDTKKSQAVWRGFISSITNGKRFYFSDINKLPALIVENLKEQQ